MGVADLVTEQGGRLHDDASGKFEAVDLPPEYPRARATWRDKLVEMVAESNEDLIETFFEKGTLAQEDLVRGLRRAVLQGRLFPVLPASSHAQRRHPPAAGRDRRPPALPGRPRRSRAGPIPSKATRPRARPAADGPLSAFVFKTIADPHAGRISLFRVYSGTFKSDSTRPQHDARRGRARGRTWSCCRARPRRRCPRCRPATSGAVAKLKETQHGRHARATRRTRSSTRRWSTPSRPPPSPSSRRRAATRTRSRRALHRLMEEDPVLQLSRDPQTHEMLLSGMGQLHIEVVVARLKQALQGRGQPQEAEDPLPGDDQGRGGGPRPPQEADGRPRPVRRTARSA